MTLQEWRSTSLDMV